MATTYFDPKSNDDLALLPSELRAPSVKELGTIAAETEWDVIAQFTDEPEATWYTARQWWSTATDISTTSAVPIKVYLRGFAVVATSADGNLFQALRRTIAEVIRWRFQWKERHTLGVTQEGSADGKSQTLKPWVDDPFPPNWDWRLKPYDTREPSVYI